MKHLDWLILLIIALLLICINAHSAERDYTRAVIHHTASHDVSAATIDIWHKERGWDGIGYHYVIRQDGTIETGRDYHKQGAHAKGRNHYTGIVLTGYDVFTDQQIISLKKLLRSLDISYIERHHELCPGEGLDVEKLSQ